MACTSNAKDNLFVWVMANGKSVLGELLIIIAVTQHFVDFRCNFGCFYNGNYVLNRTWFTWKTRKLSRRHQEHTTVLYPRLPAGGGPMFRSNGTVVRFAWMWKQLRMWSCHTFRTLVNFPKHPQGNQNCHFEVCSTSRWGTLYGQTHVSSILINQLHRELGHSI